MTYRYEGKVLVCGHLELMKDEILQNIVSIFFLARTHFLAVSPTYGKVEYLPQTEAEFTRSVNIVDLYL